MPLDIEKAQIMFKLARKGNWGGSYDREEHFNKNRFPNFDKAIKELKKEDWIMSHKKSYKNICLNPRYKKEIINFIEQQMPELKGIIR